MKNICKKTFLPFLCLLLIFAFSGGVLAFDAENFYADEESADGTMLLESIRFYSVSGESALDDGNLVIVLDPGHGGGDPGANPVKGLYESDHNIKVAQYCKAYLEQYPNVTVYLTHETFYVKDGAKLGLADRAAIAKQYNADIMISIHFNSATDTTANGSEVYISCLEEYAMPDLAKAILNGLGDLGLREIGVKTRVSESGDLWYDEIRLADYYGIIRGSCKQEIPSLIVEHCFINNPTEYETFASSDEKLKAIGESDAKAIVATFGLDKDTEEAELETLKASAMEQLDKQYESMDPELYSAYYRDKIEEIYNDAAERIDIATHQSKIDVTLNRALTTLKYYPTLPFTDVSIDDWYFDAVTDCMNKGLFYGTSEDTFSPERNITRGEFVSVLGRMAEAELFYPAETQFIDVDPELYYAPYVKWAYGKSIVMGYSATEFKPKEDIRREDLIKMIHNYCVAEDIELAEISDKTLADFTDGDTVDSWATADMAWAISVGLMQGYEDNTLRPVNAITRAEAAQIVSNFTELIAK